MISAAGRIAIRTMVLAAVMIAAYSVAKAQQALAEQPVPRVIIALLESSPTDPLRYNRVHQMATMPLEQLGLVVEYHRLSDGLPDISNRTDVRGVLTWFTATERAGALELLNWLEAALNGGKRLAMMGQIGFQVDQTLGALPLARMNRLTRRLGVDMSGSFVSYPGDAAYTHSDPLVWGFEQVPKAIPSFPIHTAVGADAKVHLQVGWYGEDGVRSDVVVTNPNGGIVAHGFDAEINPDAVVRRWRVNPFAFFRAAFGTDDLPKPDTTTLVGRRIFYSHVDGDGWRSISDIKIADRPAIAGRVLLERVVKPNPELPVTIAPIGAEIDAAWIDDAEARAVASELLALPQVEAGSHTYSHPFQWSFYKTYDAQLERKIVTSLGLGQLKPQEYEAVGNEIQVRPQDGATDPAAGPRLNERYQIPRAFYVKPYDLNLEIQGSMDRINLVGGKPVTVLQWSGDTSPYEAAVAAVREAGIVNINGGDTRFDSEYRSYGYVAPIGLPVGRERQIYASMSNENTYTDLWSGRFFGYRHLLQTVERTDLPIRVKPINVYYHTYSAEKIASLNALIEVLQDMGTRNLAPITTSRFARIGQGFYDTELIALGDRSWRVENRGALQTLRFDHASLTAVDFSRSVGVLGERPLHGGLYVALDPSVAQPIVALSDRADLLAPALAPHPYLVDSRWPISQMITDGAKVTVSLEGFGALSMSWIVPEPGVWRMRGRQADDERLSLRLTVGEDRRLVLDGKDTEDLRPMLPTTLSLERVPD
jgi:hypothetical protein